MVLLRAMKESPRKIRESEVQVTLADFLRLYNQGIPESFPRASTNLLQKYKDEHTTFFKHGEMWSLDLHRKKVMDWLPYNLKG